MSRIVDTIRREGPLGPEEPKAPTGPRRHGDPDLGAVQYFHLRDHETAERVIDGLSRLPVQNLRTAISWCDWVSEGGEEWYAWLLPKLTERFDVLPCFLYTPPELGLLPKTSSPPRDPEDYARFLEMVLRRHDGDFSHVELWNEPNNYIEWDWTIDPEWTIFAEMIGGAARRATALGVKAVLGGMSPFDPNWLDLMFKRGALAEVEVIGVHGFPGTWEAVWEGWDVHVDRVQEVLDHHGSDARVWVTESGFSTWAHDEFRQLTTMVELAVAPADRVYWYAVEDLAPERETLDGFHCDERAYHFGLQRRSGEPKLLARVLGARGLEGVREMVGFGQDEPGHHAGERDLITGGAGFIGSSLADRLAADGRPVTVLDNLSQPGAETNLRRLKRTHGDLVRVEVGDVRDVFALRRCLAAARRVFHLAASPPGGAPLHDHEVNLRGTVDLLEEARRLDTVPAIVFASTSLVYGELDDGLAGVTEAAQLALASPYACAKGAADQYVLEYARSFGLRTCAVRMSCVYGPGQSGREEQGWLGRIALDGLAGHKVGAPGCGSEVRDMLFVDDVVDAMLAISETEAALKGRAINIGGGPLNTVTIDELVDLVEELRGERPEVTRTPWPHGEPTSYVTDLAEIGMLTGWAPRVRLREGLRRLRSDVAAGDEAAALSS